MPTQQPAYGDLNVQTEWGQGVTQLLQWDSERREVPAKPWVTLLHMALLAHTRSVTHAQTSRWRGTMVKRGFGKCHLERSARGPRPGEMVVPKRPHGGRYAGKFICTDSGHIMGLVPRREQTWTVLFTMIVTAMKFNAKDSRYIRFLY